MSRKAVHNWYDKFSQGRSKIADGAWPGAEVAETTVKNFCAVGFNALVKRWDNCVSVVCGYVDN
jgi:hypothetical protein